MSDEKLTQRIKAVFDDYDDGLAEQGWAELRKKFPEKENKKLPVWWLSGIAATLLLVAGFYLGRHLNMDHVILHAGTTDKKHRIQKNNSSDSETSLPNQQLDTLGTKSDALAPHQKQHDEPFENIGQAVTGYVAGAKTTPTQNGETIVKGVSVDTLVNPTKSSVAMEQSKPMIASAKTDEKVVTNEQLGNGISLGEQPAKPKQSTAEFLNEQSALLAKNKSKDVPKKNAPSTTLDVFTGTFFNYHDNNEAKLSAGLGLNANVRVANNLVVSFGAGISQNKVSYENKVPIELSQAMFAARDNGLVQHSPTVNATYSATATNDVNFNGQLLSIDLPMVVKFFPSKKQDFYISTGINSSSYITQKYTYNYSWSNFGVRNGEAQPQQETEKSTLKGFDFANSAIIAIGINQNIGKNVLIFEPYYKPALSTMGDKNLRISSAGLNLKFNFKGNVKK